MTRPSHNLRQLAFILALLLISAYIFFNNLQTDSSLISETENRLDELAHEVEIINSTLPIKIDDNTILTALEVSNGKLVKKYQLPLHNKSDLSDAIINNQIIPVLIQESCHDERQAYFINEGISLLMQYFDKDGLFVFELLISKEDCSESGNMN